MNNLNPKKTCDYNKEQIINYLFDDKHLISKNSPRMYSRNYFNPLEILPTLDEKYSDGDWEWIDDLASYVMLYNIELPIEFVKHVEQSEETYYAQYDLENLYEYFKRVDQNQEKPELMIY